LLKFDRFGPHQISKSAILLFTDSKYLKNKKICKKTRINFDQTDEDIFSKMTSFSLLKFKFTQIFLMGQNGFSKMTELSVNVTELLVNLAELSNAVEF
jgi:hypothetical protein